MSPEQEIWERAFISALAGYAVEDKTKIGTYVNPVNERIYAINRAEHIADAAVERVMQRRKADLASGGRNRA